MAEHRTEAPARCLPGVGAAEPPTDAELLRRFASARDEEAFAVLVERHGPLVLAVCRRVLGNADDAEDAFQATFLVLARRAGSLRDPGLLGNWLYGVAGRVARKARASARKRQMYEKQHRLLPSLAAPPAVENDELRAVLDEELSRLPEKYRAALVLCYLQGKTNTEAAHLLRWPTGTVKGRLAKARELLRGRLIRRGIQASGALLAAALFEARGEAGPVPRPLAEATVRAGVRYAGGGLDVPRPRALSLARALLGGERRARLLALAVAAAVVAVAASLLGTAAAGRDWISGTAAPSHVCGGATAPEATGR